jgi:hypothetical protein
MAGGGLNRRRAVRTAYTSSGGAVTVGATGLEPAAVTATICLSLRMMHCLQARRDSVGANLGLGNLTKTCRPLRGASRIVELKGRKVVAAGGCVSGQASARDESLVARMSHYHAL